MHQSQLVLSFCGANVPSAHGVSLALPSSHALPARQIWQPSTEPRPGAALKRPAEQRASELRSTIRKTLGAPHLALPHAIVENGSRCATNGDGEKVLPDSGRTAWVPKFVSTLVDVAMGLAPMAFDPEKTYNKDDPNKKRRLLILPMLLLQTLVLRPFIVSLIRKDVKKGKGGRV